MNAKDNESVMGPDNKSERQVPQTQVGEPTKGPAATAPLTPRAQGEVRWLVGAQRTTAKGQGGEWLPLPVLEGKGARSARPHHGEGTPPGAAREEMMHDTTSLLGWPCAGRCKRRAQELI